MSKPVKHEGVAMTSGYTKKNWASKEAHWKHITARYRDKKSGRWFIPAGTTQAAGGG